MFAQVLTAQPNFAEIILMQFSWLSPRWASSNQPPIRILWMFFFIHEILDSLRKFVGNKVYNCCCCISAEQFSTVFRIRKILMPGSCYWHRTLSLTLPHLQTIVSHQKLAGLGHHYFNTPTPILPMLYKSKTTQNLFQLSFKNHTTEYG